MNTELLSEIEKLKTENVLLKQQLEKYSNPQKSYYERNKLIVNEKAKERMKKQSKSN